MRRGAVQRRHAARLDVAQCCLQGRDRREYIGDGGYLPGWSELGRVYNSPGERFQVLLL